MTKLKVPSAVDLTNFVEEKNITVIGVGSVIAADLYLRERVMIFGTVKGNVESAVGTSVLAKGGKIIGHLKGENLIIAGEVLGDVFSNKRVTLLDTAQIHGDLHFSEIIRHKDARVEGGNFLRDNAQNR